MGFVRVVNFPVFHSFNLGPCVEMFESIHDNAPLQQRRPTGECFVISFSNFKPSALV